MMMRFDAAGMIMPPPLRELSCRAAIVGIGETDYHSDYQSERARAPGYEAPSPETLVGTAFERALADSGLRREDIDGISVSFTYGGPDPQECAKFLGLAPRYGIRNGNIMAGPLPVVCAAIAAGEADTVAMVFAVASRAIGRQYGGTTYAGGEGAPSSYYYHLPWGFSSQAAHWALMATYYQQSYSVGEEGLGSVAVQLRDNARNDPNSVMQKPMTIEDYMSSRYVVRPLHLFDLCLVNDGAVCLIVSRADKAGDLPHDPVLVAGWGESKANGDKLHNLVRERLRPQMQAAGAQALGMAGLELADIQHFEGYDVSTIHLISQIEGFGFVEPGTGVAACEDGQLRIGGLLPVNTNGGNLSGSYMHGWSQLAEITRQLRHEAHGRQIPDIHASMSALVQTGQAHPIVFLRGT